MKQYLDLSWLRTVEAVQSIQKSIHWPHARQYLRTKTTVYCRKQNGRSHLLREKLCNLRFDYPEYTWDIVIIAATLNSTFAF